MNALEMHQEFNRLFSAKQRVPVQSVDTGTWLLDDWGTHFVCQHENLDTETVEVDTLDSRGEHTTYERQITVCQDCGEEQEDL